MNKYLEDNIEALKNSHNEVILNEDILMQFKGEASVERIKSYDGMMLQSNVEQDKAIQVWCDQFEELKYNSLIIVFGIGTLDYYVEFANRFPELITIILEPCEELFYSNLACGDYVDLLNHDNFYFCVGEDRFGKLYYALRSTSGQDDIVNPYYATIPNYMKIFREDYEHFEEIAINSLRTNVTSRNTDMIHLDVRVDNYLNNLSIIAEESGVAEIQKSFSQIKNLQDYPAILLAAGPSLDKNIKGIKDVKGRAFVICVDAAYNTVIKNGIRPDIVVTVDPIIRADAFREKAGRNLPLVVQMTGSTEIRKMNTGRKFYTTDVDYYLKDVFKECEKPSLWSLSTGGSVANSAFAFAMDIGFKTVILMGQDLGFPGNKQHAKDAFLDEKDIDEEDSSYYYVDSVDGGQVLTNYIMDEYRAWFERVIELRLEMNVVDATEGGALIRGSEVLTIKEAVDKYCPKEKVDFEGHIESADYLFDDEERKAYMDIINKTYEDIDDIIVYLKKAKRDYYKLRDINEKRKYNSKEFKRLVKKVGDHNKYLDENKDISLFKFYCAEKHYECVEALKKVYDDDYDNIKNIVDQGLIMIDVYIEAGKKLKGRWDNLKAS